MSCDICTACDKTCIAIRQMKADGDTQRHTLRLGKVLNMATIRCFLLSFSRPLTDTACAAMMRLEEIGARGVTVINRTQFIVGFKRHDIGERWEFEIGLLIEELQLRLSEELDADDGEEDGQHRDQAPRHRDPGPHLPAAWDSERL